MQKYNIKYTYIDKDDPWARILEATSFEMRSTENRLKGYSPGQLVFGRDMIILIKNTAEWELIHQKNQMQINKYNI